MATVAAPSSDLFYAELKEYLDKDAYYGLERSSKAILTKIADLKETQASLVVEQKKLKPDAVKILKLKRTILALVEPIFAKQALLLKDCCDIYEHTKKAKLPLLIGRGDLRRSESLEELRNFGIASSGESSLSEALSAAVPTKTEGSIFCPKHWTLYANMAFIVGGIRAGNSFCLAAKDIKESDLWDKEENCITHLGWEIALLHIAGYVQLATKEQMEKYGAYFACCDDKPKSFSLTYFHKELSKIKSGEVILSFLSPV